MNSLADLWANLLSDDTLLIRRVWASLGADERQAVLAHLTQMRDEEGWHPAQHESAAAALRAIHDLA